MSAHAPPKKSVRGRLFNVLVTYSKRNGPPKVYLCSQLRFASTQFSQLGEFHLFVFTTLFSLGQFRAKTWDVFAISRRLFVARNGEGKIIKRGELFGLQPTAADLETFDLLRARTFVNRSAIPSYNYDFITELLSKRFDCSKLFRNTPCVP